MSSSGTCKECRTLIAPESPGGYCARCLLGLGLETAGDGLAAKQISDPGRCKNCGTGIQPNAPFGYCAQCLVELGFGPLPTILKQPEQSPASGPVSAPARVHYFGDYELLEEIARGGMGVVFKARQISLNRLVAVKLISSGTLATEDLVKRFKAEAEAAASLSHPNIVPIYEIGEHHGQHYFSMGLIEGPNLRDEIANRKSQIPNCRNAARLVSTIARAVHYAHQRGVLHRDIKPSNILLDSAGQPHLTDFGLAKLVQKESTLTHTYAMLGTPAYMSPEQARGETKEVTTAADVYGLGAVLYETLTGSPPFAGGTSMETIRQVLDQEPRRPSLWNATVDRDLETICLKCLEKEPGRRYPSAEELEADLDRWRRHEPILVRPSTAFERLQKWVHRRPAIAALVAGLALSLVVGMAGVLWQWTRADQQAERATKTADELRQNLYASEIGEAFRALEDGDVHRVRELLESKRPRPHEPDLRGFEWRYLWGQSRTQEVFTIDVKSESYSYGCAISPNGRYLAVDADVGNEIQLWDLASRQQIVKWDVSGSLSVDDLDFDPHNKILATTHAGLHCIRLWDLDTMREMKPALQVADMAHGVAFSPEGRWLATAAGRRYGQGIPGEAKIWDTATRQVRTILPGVRDWLTRVKFSPDGRWIAASGGGGFVKIWDVVNGREVIELTGLRGIVFGLCFSPNGETLAAADSLGMIRLWRVGSWEERLTFRGHEKLIGRIAISPDGQVLASASTDQTVKLWNHRNGELLNTLRGHSQRVTCVSFLTDGSLLASTSLDGTLKLWNTLAKQEESVFHGHKAFWGVRVEFSPDGRWLGMTTNAPGTDPLVLRTAVFDAATRQVITAIAGHPFKFAPDGTLATKLSDSELALWRIEPTGAVEKLRLAAASKLSDSLAFSPDSNLLAARCADHVVIWSLRTPTNPRTIRRTGPPHHGALLFSADSETLITGVDDEGLLECWNIRTLRRVGEMRPGLGAKTTPSTLSFDGRMLATIGPEDAIQLWDLVSRTKLREFRHRGLWVQSMQFSPDGKTLAGGAGDGGVHLWNVASGSEITAMAAHGSACRSVSFSPDGRWLATAGVTDTIKLWFAPSFEDIKRQSSTFEQR